MSKKSIPYYINTIKLKSTSWLHHNGILKYPKDEKLAKILNEVTFPINSTFTPVYISFTYWKEHKDFRANLVFENNIAIGEKNNHPSYLISAIYSLILLNDYLCFKEQDLLKLFYEHLTFLEENAIKTDHGVCWHHTEDIPRFSLKGKWSSGITQAIIASAFLRAYHNSKEERYLDLAEQCITFALQKEGKLYTELNEHMYWIEEYPTETGKGVLNGYIFFLIALAELNQFRDFQDWLDQGIKTLVHYLPEFQFGKHIKYASSLPEYGNVLYQVIHEHQLLHLSKLIEQAPFEKLKDYWSSKMNKKLIDDYFGNS